MNIIERIKGILVKPKEEWLVINGESTSSSALVINYLLPLAVIAALATFFGFFFALPSGFIKIGIYYAIFALISLVVAVYATAYITDALAPSFASEKNINKSTQLVVYSATPVFVGALLGLLPRISWLGLLAGAIYSIYLLFLGIPVLKKTPEDKTPIYLIVILLSAGIIHWLVGYILAKLFASSLGYGIFMAPF